VAGDFEETPVARSATLDREWLLGRLHEAFGTQFVVFAVVAVFSCVLAYYIKGPVVFGAALTAGVDLLLSVLPRLGAALLIAGFIRVLVSQELVARWLGQHSGVKSLLIAGVAGALTPGGPITAFSLIAALKTAGADRGVLVAYATGWAMLGFQRVLLWELPLLGAEIVSLRLAASCLLPLFAGLAARRIPIDINLPSR